MKKTITIIFVLAFLTITAQDYNQKVKPEKGQEFLVGPVTLEGLQQAPYKTWYDTSYESYQVDESLVKMIGKKLKGYNLKLFLGTWCGDSKREVPRMVKILESAKYPIKELELITLDRRKEFYKKSPGGEEKGWNIIKIPTLIVLKDGKEINRIVESPIASLEEDLLAILSTNSYTPNYSSN
ncbi:thioredoxin family protein [uncultured Croceitalea sp.]|uniref:thioredoxin family protein n=1 Tax=uncultured Croceitalea sp. TaxID=1798908 RepID=UPI0033064521